MKQITGYLAVATWIILIVLLLILTPNYINKIIKLYGPEYLLGTLSGDLLIILLVFWIGEKIILFLYGLSHKKVKEKRNEF